MFNQTRQSVKLEKKKKKKEKKKKKRITINNSKRPTPRQATSNAEDDLHAALNIWILINSTSSKDGSLDLRKFRFRVLRSPLHFLFCPAAAFSYPFFITDSDGE